MISVIIPTYNEAAHIVRTIENLRAADVQQLVQEIIVADGGSKDETVSLAAAQGVRAIACPQKGRAAQMNYGASLATGSILYFLHADTLPPPAFTNDIVQHLQRDYGAGCFMLAFDHPHWFLKFNCWFTRFPVDAFRYGDQSLFVQRELFEAVNGFCNDLIVFEDYDIIKRLQKISRFAVVKRPVVTSARKYLENGVYKMQGIFYLMYFLYRLGWPQHRLVSTYRRLIRQDKL